SVIALESVIQRERGQPGLAPDSPQLVGRLELVRGVQRAQIDFHFLCAAPKDRGAAAGAEITPLILLRVTGHDDGILGEDGGAVKERAMVLAAVETVADADTVGLSGCGEANLAAEATAGNCVHVASPGGYAVGPGRPTWDVRRVTPASLLSEE